MAFNDKWNKDAIERCVPFAGLLFAQCRVLGLACDLVSCLIGSIVHVRSYMKSSRDDAPYLPSNVDFVVKVGSSLLTYLPLFLVACMERSGCDRVPVYPLKPALQLF